MSTPLTVILAFRDREPMRVRRCLDSLAMQNMRDFEVFFVDSGSHPRLACEVEQLVSEYEFARYVYSATRGHPWNRSMALNGGIRRAAGDFLMTTDVDMVFAPDFLDVVCDRMAEDRVLYCYHQFLPRGFEDWNSLEAYSGRLPVAGTTAYGACQIAHAKVLRELRGFDEYYRYWGIEDRDLNHRLRAADLREEWINDRTEMFHQWHPRVDYKQRGFFPTGLWGRMELHHLMAAGTKIRNDASWGRLLTTEDRPAFVWLDLEEERLRDSANLYHFDERPYDDRSIGAVLHAFWDLPEGHALAVHGAGLPRHHRWLEAGIGAANRLLRAARSGSEVDYRSNAVHAFLAEMVHENPMFVADYYLDLPDGDGVIVLVRADRDEPG